MKSRESRLRLRQFELEEKQRKVAEIESMIAEFRRMADDLDTQIEAEEQRAGVSDVEHFAYPPFAKAALQRRDNLLNSVAELNDKLEEAVAEMTEVASEVEKAEMTAERAQDTTDNTRGNRSNGGTRGSSFARYQARTY